MTGALVPLQGLPKGRLRGAATNLRFKTLEKQALNGSPLVIFRCVPALDMKKLLRYVPRPPILTYVLLTYVLEIPDPPEKFPPKQKSSSEHVSLNTFRCVTYHSPRNFYKLIPLPFFFLYFFFCNFYGNSLRPPIFFVTPMRSSGSRVDWKIFLVIFTKLIPHKNFFCIAKILVLMVLVSQG